MLREAASAPFESRLPVTRTLPVTDAEVVGHFTVRASRYDQSSHWVTDPLLAERVWSLLEPEPHYRILDVACGTGLWSRVYHGRVRHVVGVDVTPAMYRPGRPHVDHMVDGPAENLPFRDGVFDISTVRQGIQFMDARKAVLEMARVTRSGGRVCLVQLCAYGPEDRDEYFEILRLRNPSRRNFFLREDLEVLLHEASCTGVTVFDYISEEDVDVWSDHGAIDEGRREAIRAAYERASSNFKKYHAVKKVDGRYVDRMLFGLAIGVIP